MPESQKYTLVNPRINGVPEAVFALQKIDYEHIKEIGLQTRIDIYMGATADDRTNQHLTASYYGLPIGGAESAMSEISIPAPVYRLNNTLLNDRRVPLDVIQYRPGNIELSAATENIRDYGAIDTFVQKVLTHFKNMGYKQHNTNHLSIAWLAVGEAGSQFENFVCISAEGLQVRGGMFKDKTIFTEREIERLRDLTPPKAVNPERSSERPVATIALEA